MSRATRLGLALLISVCASSADAIVIEDLEFKHGIAFFQDLKYPADFTHFDYLNPDAPKGGRLVLASPLSFNTLAPMPQGETGAPSGYYFRGDTLIVRSGDEITAFYGRLADGIAVTEDERTIIFRIHPEARWDDGVPITAGDVVFTFETHKAQLGAGYFFRFIESVEALDTRHVAFRVIAPLTHDHVTLIQYIPILPQHYWRDRDLAAHTLEPPVSSGPYRIKQVKAGRYIEYERNLDYWARDLPLNRGRYNFDTVRYEVYRDATVAREAFRKGLIDILDESDIRYWVNGYEGSDLESGRIRKIRREYGISVGIGIAIILNSQVPRLADRGVRKALALALDYEWINEKLYHGERTRALSYWPGTILSATGLPSEDELALLSRFRNSLPTALFERPFNYPKTGSRAAFNENLLKARNLLAASGWQFDDGALRDAGGAPFTLEFLTLDPANTRILLPWSAALARLGIEAKIRLVDAIQYTNRFPPPGIRRARPGLRHPDAADAGVAFPLPLHLDSEGRLPQQNRRQRSRARLSRRERGSGRDPRSVDRGLPSPGPRVALGPLPDPAVCDRSASYAALGQVRTPARTNLSTRLPRRLVVRRIQGGAAQYGTLMVFRISAFTQRVGLPYTSVPGVTHNFSVPVPPTSSRTDCRPPEV